MIFLPDAGFEPAATLNQQRTVNSPTRLCDNHKNNLIVYKANIFLISIFHTIFITDIAYTI